MLYTPPQQQLITINNNNMSRQLLNTVKDKLSKEDLIDIIVELQEEIDGWENDYDTLMSTKNDIKQQLYDIEQDRSNAWTQAKYKQDRIAQLFGKFERIARLLNQNEDACDNDTLINDIVGVIEDEFEIVDGKFVNHKKEQL